MATAAQIGNLNVRLAMDTAQFAAGVKTVQSSLGTLGTAFKAFAASAAVNFLGQMGLAAVRAGAQIGDLAETIGITAEQVQVFNRLAVASGSSSESMAKGLQSIAEQSVDAESKLSKLFAANGIAAQGMAVNDVIRTFTDLLKNARNPAEQLAIATEVLGTRVGRDLIEALRDGSKGYDQAMQDMLASGELMSNAEIERLQQLETEYNKVTDRIAQYWMKMVTNIVSGIDAISSRAENTGGQMVGRFAVPNRMLGPGPARTSGLGSMGGPNEYNSAPVKVEVTKLLGETQTTKPRDKPSASPSWRSGSSENPMQGGDVTGYDLRGNGLVIDELTTDLQQANTAAYDLAESITDTLGSALVGLANGTMSFKDAFSSMAQSLLSDLADITSQLLKSGLMSLLGNFGGGFGAMGLGGFGGFYAEGGTLGAGKWGIAGENGPEVIKGPASISPMGGGSTQVNIYNQGGGQVEQRKRRGSGGQDIVDVYIRGVARDEALKTQRKSLPGVYGTPAALTQR
jgi:hypothetical protein